jgi:hypothetical protein
MINHCDRCVTHLSDTDTVQSETYHDIDIYFAVYILYVFDCTVWMSSDLIVNS